MNLRAFKLKTFKLDITFESNPLGSFIYICPLSHRNPN